MTLTITRHGGKTSRWFVCGWDFTPDASLTSTHAAGLMSSTAKKHPPILGIHMFVPLLKPTVILSMHYLNIYVYVDGEKKVYVFFLMADTVAAFPVCVPHACGPLLSIPSGYNSQLGLFKNWCPWQHLMATARGQRDTGREAEIKYGGRGTVSEEKTWGNQVEKKKRSQKSRPLFRSPVVQMMPSCSTAAGEVRQMHAVMCLSSLLSNTHGTKHSEAPFGLPPRWAKRPGPRFRFLDKPYSSTGRVRPVSYSGRDGNVC